VLVVQPHSPNASHAEPLALPVQSPSDTQLTQEWVVVLHTILPQSVFARHPTHSDVCGLHTAGGPSPPLQSALVVHLGSHQWYEVLQALLAGQSVPDEHPHRFVVVSQIAPAGLPAHSASDEHPHLFVNGLQVVPAGLPAQSALVTQPTQRPVDVLQAVPRASPVQSEFDVQAGSHENERGPMPASGQVSPDGQSAFALHPHVPGAPPEGTEPDPDPELDPEPGEPASTALGGPAGADMKHTLPPGEAAQSALVAHPPHRPVVVLHTGPVGLPAQSALLAQPLVHRSNGPHAWPLAQSITTLRQCVPPAALAQSAMVEHPHVCRPSHTGPSGFVAQSALALHATQTPVETSHAAPVALPVQSESLLQRFSHWVRPK
jgi:hypothetical protein